MHDKDNELELERELHELPIIYQWEIIRCDFGNTLRWVISIGFPFFGYSFLLLLIQDMDAVPVLFFIGLIMTFVIRYLFLSDNQHHYFLTKKGIHFTTEQIIPEMAYKVMRGFAWFGVAVSFLAVTIIGPMAFIGAGACALLSFKMTGFKSVPRSSFVYFVDEYTVFDIQKENTFSIISHPHDIYDSCYRLYYFLDDRDEIKNQLLQVIKKSHYKIINHPDDIYDYAPFEPSENLSINNAIDNKDKIETMRMALYNEEVLYEYETIEHQYLGYFAAAGFFSVMLWFLYDFSDDGIDAGEAIIFGGGGTIMTLFLIFFASADIKRLYKFTKNGIVTEQADVVPEYAYQCIRMIGRVGVVVCLIAVVFVGPMAFIGAGASALLSFKLVNFKLKPMLFESLYFDESVIIKSSKINYITVVPNANFLLSLNGLFCNKENVDDIFNTLKEFYPNGHFYEVEEEDDIYEHEKFKEFLHPMDQD